MNHDINNDQVLAIIYMLKAIPAADLNSDDVDWPLNGYVTVDKLDYEGMEVAPEAFDETIPEYMMKGAPVTWDHNREIVIGKAIRLRKAIDPRSGLDALEIEGVQFAPNGLVGVAREKALLFRNYYRKGVCRGLSLEGKSVVGGIKGVFSKALNKMVPRVVRAWLYDITITPLQVNPGAQFTVPGVAFSKALKAEAFRQLYAANGQESLTAKPYSEVNW